MSCVRPKPQVRPYNCCRSHTRLLGKVLGIAPYSDTQGMNEYEVSWNFGCLSLCIRGVALANVCIFFDLVVSVGLASCMLALLLDWWLERIYFILGNTKQIIHSLSLCDKGSLREEILPSPIHHHHSTPVEPRKGHEIPLFS